MVGKIVYICTMLTYLEKGQGFELYSYACHFYLFVPNVNTPVICSISL